MSIYFLNISCKIDKIVDASAVTKKMRSFFAVFLTERTLNYKAFLFQLMADGYLLSL